MSVCQSDGLSLDVAVRDALQRRRGDWVNVARECSVSHSWISQFVRGKIPNPGYATLCRLQRYLALSAGAAQSIPVREVSHG